MNQYALKCEKIGFKYGTKLILEDISTEFKTGHLYGILGPNGSGKSTFIKILSGILKQKYGSVFVDGIDIKKISIRTLAKELAVVNQTNKIEFDFTVNEIIKMGLFSHVGRFSKESEKDKKIIKDILNQFNLYTFKDRKFNHLSGGEQQKVIIARAIAQQSKIILFDEPTTHLDINYQIEFMERLTQYVKDGFIIVVVLHDLNLATQFCDKLILLNNGQIYAFGTPEQVITCDNLNSIYNINVIVKKNLYNDSIYVTPLRAQVSDFSNFEKDIYKKKVHIIVGGGSALKILPKLTHCDVSVGVVNVLDDDYALAKDLNYKIISEAPFSPISEDSRKNLVEQLEKVDLIVLASVPFGKNNLDNLKALHKIKIPILIFEETSIEKRDYTGGIATTLYNNIKNKKKVKTAFSLHDLFNYFKNNLRGC